MKRYRIFALMVFVLLFVSVFGGCGTNETEVTDSSVESAIQSAEEAAVNSPEEENAELPAAGKVSETEAPEQTDETVEPVIYEFELSDLYSEGCCSRISLVGI